MSDILCLYYSRTGTTRTVMEQIAELLEAELVEILGAMSGVYLTQGTHTVSFTYHNRAFYQGLTVSCAALLLLLALTALVYLRRKGKHQMNPL